jgi:hypothetical protein
MRGEREKRGSDSSLHFSKRMERASGGYPRSLGWAKGGLRVVFIVRWLQFSRLSPLLILRPRNSQARGSQATPAAGPPGRNQAFATWSGERVHLHVPPGGPEPESTGGRGREGVSNECSVPYIFLCNHNYETGNRSRTGSLGALGATGPLLPWSPSSGSRRSVPASSTSRSFAPVGPSVTRAVAAAACAEGRPPPLGKPGAPVPAAGPPSRQRGAELHGPFGRFRRALGSVRVRGGAGAPARVRAELAGPSQCARAGASCSPEPPLPPPPLPLPRPANERASSAAEAAEIGICLPAARRRRRRRAEGGGKGGEGGSSSRASAPRETTTVRPREGRPGPGRCTPRAEAEPGPAAPRLSVPARAERRRMSFSGSRWVGGWRRSAGAPREAGEVWGRRWRRRGGRDAPPRGLRERPPGPAARPARACPFVRLRTTPGTLLEALNGNGALLPLRSCAAAAAGTGSRDPARERERSVFSAGTEAGRSARPARQLGCGKAPGFPLRPCELVHLLFCAASAAMSVVILHFDFVKLCAGLRYIPPTPVSDS